MGETETLIMIGFIILLLLCSAFFSGSETALMSSSKPKLHKMAKEGNTKAERVNNVTQDPEKLLSTILLGNNLVNIAASALTTGVFIELFGDSGIAMATLIMTFLVLIFAEIIPKTVASRNPEKHSLWIAFPMTGLVYILRPFTKFIQAIASVMLRLIGIKPNESGNFDEDDVRGAIGMGLEEGVLEKGEHRMLDSVMKLDEMTVADVMIHRRDIEMLNADTPLEEIYRILSTKPVHSRLPLWRNDKDNLIGILLVKDFFKAHYYMKERGKEFKIEDVMQETYFVPESVLLNDQIVEFQTQRKHMAIVVDEYGDIQGVVTLEDILEEIVGDILDEHDIVKTHYRMERDNSITVTGQFPVRDANKEFGWSLPEEEDAVTLGGFIIENLSRIPDLGETIELHNIQFKVIMKRKQAITKLRATLIDKEDTVAKSATTEENLKDTNSENS